MLFETSVNLTMTTESKKRSDGNYDWRRPGVYPTALCGRPWHGRQNSHVFWRSNKNIQDIISVKTSTGTGAGFRLGQQWNLGSVLHFDIHLPIYWRFQGFVKVCWFYNQFSMLWNLITEITLGRIRHVGIQCYIWGGNYGELRLYYNQTP